MNQDISSKRQLFGEMDVAQQSTVEFAVLTLLKVVICWLVLCMHILWHKHCSYSSLAISVAISQF